MKLWCHIALAAFFMTLISEGVSADSKGNIKTLNRMNVGPAYTPKALGLFIGIQEFNDPFWHELKYPRKDVRDMIAFFTDNATISLDDQIVLTEPTQTTRDYILTTALDAFKMKNTSEEDFVIVYISGHGTLSQEPVVVFENGEQKKEIRNRPYIVTIDTRKEMIQDSAIPLDKVIDWFEKLHSRRKTLILDMCHSGLGKSQISPDQARIIHSSKGIHFTPLADSWASVILSACPVGGTSYEDMGLSNSVYTHFLLKGMKQGDLNGDKAITISEAHNYAIEETQAYTWKNKGEKQVPTAYTKVLGKDPIFVNGSPENKGVPVLFSYSSVNHDVEVYVDNVYKGMLPKGIRLDSGAHEIECRHIGKTLFSEKMEIAAGFEYMLPDLFERDDEKKWLVMAEGGYRDYLRSDVPGKLIPAGLTGGFSVYSHGLKKEWLGFSGGVDVTQNYDLTQFAIRLGLKFSKKLNQTSRLYLGPDLMTLLFQHANDTVADIEVDQKMTLVCPGGEALICYTPANTFVLATGIRCHYVPYSLYDKINQVVATQFFIGCGYNF